VKQRLIPGIQMLYRPMGISVSGKQSALEKDHAGDPDRRSSTEPGENGLRNHRLDQEEQEGGQKYRKDEKNSFGSCDVSQQDRLHIYFLKIIAELLQNKGPFNG